MEEFLTDETFPRTHKAQYAMIFSKNEGIVVFGRKVDIQVGQLFKKLDTTKYVFEVVSLKADAMGTVHVQMRRRDEPSSRRTLAASVLLDPEQFEQIG